MRTPTHITIATLLLSIACGGAAETAYAIGTQTTLVLRPHCLMDYKEDNVILESDGDPEEIQCSSFSVQDPQTLKTPALAAGDILDLDVVIENPDKIEIARARTWLAYDPSILKGDSVEVSEEFPIVTPGESTFSEGEGFVKIEAAVESDGPKDLQILVARVQFTVLKTAPAGTVITFYDVQSDGHSTVVTGTGEEQRHVMNAEPSALLVVFANAGSAESTSGDEVATASAGDSETRATAVSPQATLLADGDVCITDPQCRSGHCAEGVCQAAGALIPDGGACGSNIQCHSGSCVENVCTASTPSPANALLGMGQVCTGNAQCQSGLCSAGICIPSLDAQRMQGPSSAAVSSAPSAAFGLLQIQNVRITTEGASVFLGWDALKSSQLQGYNIYYGTTTGRYIQRKSVAANVQSLALRSLPEGTTYYFAMRAVGSGEQESAFSAEVSVTVGDPKTSTSPLAASAIGGKGGQPVNPVQGSVTQSGGRVQGETGIPSTLGLLGILSAGIGTAIASRRQMLVSTDRAPL